MLNTNLLSHKIKWLSSVILFSIVSSVNAQEGYNWQFSGSTPPFVSTPAVSGSPNYTLTTLGSGSISTGVAQTVQVATDCGTNMEVGSYSKPFGFKFSNTDASNGHPINGTYSIELIISPSVDATNPYRRLIGFRDVSTADPEGPGDYGIYIRPNGSLLFYAGGAENPANILPDAAITAGAWHHLVITRDAATKNLSCYQNNVPVGTFNDASNIFMPSSAYNYAINFLKDDGPDESSGKIARIGVYNYVLSATEIQQRYSSICTLSPNGTANYIPKFSSTSGVFTNSLLYDNGISVGIGTTSLNADYKLFVETGIRTRKVKVDITNWPDYVFDQKYALPDLKEVESFISKNKHLPGVPSAKQIEHEGADVGDSQATLLKKIEELTLYLIEMNKRIDKLSEDNEMLKRKLEIKAK